MIPGYEGLYMVSNLGRVKSLNYRNTGKEHLLIPRLNNKGYQMVCLSKNGVARNYTVHKLVALAFIPNPNNLPEVNHKDENKMNCSVDNLEWCDRKYNCNYGTAVQRSAEKNKNGVKSVEVEQWSLDDKLIKVWPSMMEVQRQLCADYSNISKCCRGKQKTAYGYKWSYHLP